MFLEIITCDPSIYNADHSDFTVSTFMEKSIGLQRAKHAKTAGLYILFCLFDLILYVHSTIFQLCRTVFLGWTSTKLG